MGSGTIVPCDRFFGRPFVRFINGFLKCLRIQLVGDCSHFFSNSVSVKCLKTHKNLEYNVCLESILFCVHVRILGMDERISERKEEKNLRFLGAK